MKSTEELLRMRFKDINTSLTDDKTEKTRGTWSNEKLRGPPPHPTSCWPNASVPIFKIPSPRMGPVLV